MRKTKNKNLKSGENKKADNSKKKSDLQVRGRIWVGGKSGTFLGYGRVVLLERIKNYGSISEAAKSMKMSYRHAWELVESMNTQSKSILVRTSTGGKGGGGAQLTAAGNNAIDNFWKLYDKFKKFMKKEGLNITF